MARRPDVLAVSQSGVGAQEWIFFTDPVVAATARQVGTALVREAITIRGRMSLLCYGNPAKVSVIVDM
ncbi:TOTE conflict system archaeo-eukaryotic primase domain-containing protein [Intrasporangium sp.]|uniref:TOTE conflict system archaeo-eukaryotic primase domain-containing protein n=1 Tax=Intrasporangium sp. TaxID=1925024 RepID=UPI0039C875CE